MSVGLFSTRSNLAAAGYPAAEDHYGVFLGGGGKQLGIQLLGVAALAAWSLLLSGVLASVLRSLKFLRLSHEDEVAGMDDSGHGHGGRRAPRMSLQSKR